MSAQTQSHPQRYELLAHAPADRVIALGGDGARTVAELQADLQRLLAVMPQRSEAQSAILIACVDRYRFAVSLLASWSSGFSAALPPSHHPRALADLTESAGIAAVLHDGEAEKGIDVRSALDAPLSAPLHASARALGVLDADARAVTLYTSGTTGEQAAVPKTARQLLGEVEVLASCFGDGIERVLCTLPPRHIYGLLFGLLLPLRAGGAFARETPLHTDAVLSAIARHAIDTLVAVPAHLQGLQSVARADLGGLTRVFSSGATLRPDTFNDLVTRLELRAIEVFGSTETGGIGYRRAPRDPYTAFPGVEIAVAEDGRLLLSSQRLAPELAQPHACDDHIELTSESAFVHLGRADDVVKVGGTRVSLAAIERAVRGLPGVRDAALVARAVSGARSQEILLAVVGDGWDAARMRSALLEHIDPIAMPRRFRFVAELPREPTGKLRRAALLELFARPFPSGDEPRAQSGVLELERGAETRSESAARIELRVPAELEYLRGHFDHWPVLPGVVQLGVIAVREAKSAWPDLPALQRVRRLKLKRPIAPDQWLALELVRLADGRVDFTLLHEGAICSSGSMIFGAGVTP